MRDIARLQMPDSKSCPVLFTTLTCLPVVLLQAGCSYSVSSLFLTFFSLKRLGDWNKSPQSYFPVLSFIKRKGFPGPRITGFFQRLETPCPLTPGRRQSWDPWGAGCGLRNQASVNSNPGADIDFLLILQVTLFLSFPLCNKVNRTHQSPRRVFKSAQRLQGTRAFYMGVPQETKILNAWRQVVENCIKKKKRVRTCSVISTIKPILKSSSSLFIKVLGEELHSQSPT